MLVLLSLAYTQTLPLARLKSELFAPPRAPVVRVATPTKSVAVANHRAFDPHLLFAPRLSTPPVNQVDRTPPAPVIGIASDTAAIQVPTTNGVPFGILGSIPDGPSPPTTAKPEKGLVRIGSILESTLIHKVMPIYPPAAKAARVQGVVEFTAVIDKEGNIANLQLVRGSPLLVNSAKEAVLQWKYRPTLLNGQPVEVVTEVFVHFTLNQ